MNIADKLRKVLEIKNNIKAALEEKGIENVGNDFSNYAESIANIKGGGDEPEPEIPEIPDPPVVEIPEIVIPEIPEIPELEPWVQPEDWIDLRTVLEENVIEEYPYRIAMMVDDSESMEFYFHSNTTNDLSNIVKPDYILCSNRTDYDSENISQGMVHTWDGEAENGYRWIIFYFSTTNIKFPFEKYQSIQVILDGITVNAYSEVSLRGSSFITTYTLKGLSKYTVSVESINNGRIYSFYKTSYSSEYYSAFQSCTQLIYVGDGVIYEGQTRPDNLFKDCSSLKYVPSTLVIGNFYRADAYSMFENCLSLTHIPFINTSKCTNFTYMFRGCTSLFTIPELNTSKGTRFDYMFDGCSNLTHIPLIDTSHGTDFSFMFNNCTSLLTIPLIDTSQGTNFRYMFNNCTSLLTIPELNTSKGTNFIYMFQNCKSLLTIPELNTSKGTNFSYMFWNCKSLLTIPELNTSNGTNFDYMFSDCTSLLTIPSLDLSLFTVGGGSIFKNCSSLTYIPQLNMPLFSGELKFEGCSNLEVIVGINAPLLTKLVISYDKVYYIGRIECPSCTSIDLPGSSLKYIEYIDTSSLDNFSYLFANCSNLKTIPELNTSKGTNFSYMFNNCSSLLTIPELNTSNGTRFDYMFNNCSSLLTIPELNTSNGTRFDYMFNGCSSLLTIPLIDTSQCTDFKYMFNGCKNLETIPLIDTSNGTTFSYMFSNSGLTYLPLIDTSKGSASNDFTYMFRGCTKLKTIPELNLSNAQRVDYMFSGCTSLEYVHDLELPNVKRVDHMFGGCSKLKSLPSINAPLANSVVRLADNTSLEEIGDLKFPSATSSVDILGSLSIKETINKIGVIDFSSYNSGSLTIPVNSRITNDLKIIGSIKYNFGFATKDGISAILIRNLEIESIEKDVGFSNWKCLTKQSLLNILNALVPQEEGVTKKLTLNKTYHIPLLTDEEIAIATNKGWTISEENLNI